MNEAIRKIVKWGIIGGVSAAGITILISSSQPPGHRVAMALLALGAGVVVAAMLAGNFMKHDEGESHGPPSAGH